MKNIITISTMLNTPVKYRYDVMSNYNYILNKYQKLYVQNMSDYLTKSKIFGISNKHYSVKSDKYYTDMKNKKENDKYRNMIEWVKFNDKKKSTTVKWSDGTFTTVKTAVEDNFDPYAGVALCMAKKMCGNRAVFNEIIEKWGNTYTVENDVEEKETPCKPRKYKNKVKYTPMKQVKKE